MEILRSNANRLKRLLQQILDFRKVESKKMEVNVSKSNLSSFVSGIVASNFQSLARKKNISLSTRIEDGIWGYTDIDKLDKILFNLLSNSIKYTPEHKKINVSMTSVYKEGCRYLILKVEDEGIGIAEKDIKQIFTKFYNSKSHPRYQSNGIGLSLTKELVTLHHGNIEVSSELGKGSLFTVEIPIDREAYSEQEIVESSPLPFQDRETDIPQQVQTSHIPIIMLTAKNAANDQIECYKAGAESYIAKPFEMKILQARIDNLLQSREQCRQSFRSKMEINISNLDYQSADEEFLNNAMQCVEWHIQESDFDTVQMASDLHISRSTLSRKCKVITGCTPLEFIRNIKLKYACSLLKKKAISISEVAYATGFSSPKYFTKCFKEEFGMTPTEYQNQ